MESAVAGLSVGTVVGLSAGTESVDAFISTNLIFGTGVPVGGALGDLDAFLEGEGGQLAACLLRARGRGNCRVVVVVLVAMVVRTKFSQIFLMGFC